MFPIFPEFTALELKHKNVFEKLIQNYPPVSDISFSTLMIWWTHGNPVQVALLENNLVINYYLPSDPRASGLCVIGSKNLDKTLMQIFAYLQKTRAAPRLVHVPDFVVKKLDKHKFRIKDEEDYKEYLLDAFRLARLDSPSHAKIRRKVGKFLREAGEDVNVKELNLNSATTKKILLQKDRQWRKKYGCNNDKHGIESVTINKAIKDSKALGFKALGVYKADELHGFAIFQVLENKSCLIVNHIRNQKFFDRTFDYVIHQVACWASDKSIKTINLEMDLGIPGLRTHKMELRPVGFLKKYTVTPL